jgi:hypothetical protein
VEKRILDSMGESGSKLVQHHTEAEVTRPTAQILQFRPRERPGDHTASGTIHPIASEPELLDDLAQYEQDREEDEAINYPQRMLMNVIAVAIVTLLIGVGVWLADTITTMEEQQDCVLQGRQNCAPIAIAAPTQK